MDKDALRTAIWWFIGSALLTQSAFLGIIIAVIAYNRVARKNAQFTKRPKAFQQAQEEPFVDVSYKTVDNDLRPDEAEIFADAEKNAKYVVFETEQNIATAEKTDKKVKEPKSETQEQAEKYLAALKSSKKGIDDPAIAEKITGLEKVVESIYTRLEEKPDQSKEVRRFMEKTMPLTTGVLASYSRMNEKDINSSEFLKMEKEVNDLLTNTKNAYTKLYDSLYDGDIMDISSEISVLKTLLSQEGLLDSEFDIDFEQGKEKAVMQSGR